MTPKWEATTIDNQPVTKAQRQGLCKWGLPRDIVRKLTKSEATAIYEVLHAIVIREKLKESSAAQPNI